MPNTMPEQCVLYRVSINSNIVKKNRDKVNQPE